jgi:rhomboid family GlyGly-CTERM serine protease
MMPEHLEEAMNLSTLTTTVFQLAIRIPVTLTIGLMAIVIASVPSAGEMLQFHRAEIAAGEIWRLASGHLTHWNVEHVQWDLLMFVVLGAACERRNPRRMWFCLIAAATSVSILIFCLFPSIEAYRGLSGIDTALFMLLAIDLMRDRQRQQSGMFGIVICGLLVGFVAKTAYEAITGHAFFVDHNSAGFRLLVWDHIAASVVGVIIAFGISHQRGKHEQRPLRNGFRPVSLRQQIAQN